MGPVPGLQSWALGPEHSPEPGPMVLAPWPGSMFLVAYLGKTPLLGVPACGLYHRITVLDLVLPRVLAGERVGKSELAFLGHGGLCSDCLECIYPHCPFGKAT